MDWLTIRHAFVRARGKRKPTDIAKAAGLHQSAVWKLENNDDLGPSVGTFIKALDGLGYKPSEFFRQIEQGGKMTLPVTAELDTVRGSDTPREGSAHASISPASLIALLSSLDGGTTYDNARFLEQFALALMRAVTPALAAPPVQHLDRKESKRGSRGA